MAGRLDQAAVLFDKAVELLWQEGSADSEPKVLIEMYCGAAWAYSEKGEHGRAEQRAKTALETAQKHGIDTSHDLVQSAMGRCIGALAQRVAIEQQLKSKHGSQVRPAWYVEEEAKSGDQRDKKDELRERCVEAEMAIGQETPNPVPTGQALLLSELAYAYMVLGDAHSAVKIGWRDVEAQVKLQEDPKDPRIALSRDRLTTALFYSGDMLEAEKMANEAVAALEKTDDEDEAVKESPSLIQARSRAVRRRQQILDGIKQKTSWKTPVDAFSIWTTGKDASWSIFGCGCGDDYRNACTTQGPLAGPSPPPEDPTGQQNLSTFGLSTEESAVQDADKTESQTFWANFGKLA